MLSIDGVGSIEKAAQRGHPTDQMAGNFKGGKVLSKHQCAQRVARLREPVRSEFLSLLQGTLDIVTSFNLVTLDQITRPIASRSKRLATTTSDAQ